MSLTISLFSLTVSSPVNRLFKKTKKKPTDEWSQSARPQVSWLNVWEFIAYHKLREEGLELDVRTHYKENICPDTTHDCFYTSMNDASWSRFSSERLYDSHSPWITVGVYLCEGTVWFCMSKTVSICMCVQVWGRFLCVCFWSDRWCQVM